MLKTAKKVWSNSSFTDLTWELERWTFRKWISKFYEQFEHSWKEVTWIHLA